MLRTRIITALVLLIVFSAALYFASIQVFALVLAFLVAAAAWEWSRLCGETRENAQTAFAAAAGLLTLIILYVPYSDTFMRWLMLLGFLFWVSVPALFYLAPRQRPIEHLAVPQLTLGVVIFLVTAMAIQYLRSFAPHGSSWLLLYCLAIVWCMDIGAYFSGIRFGRHKLAPGISPGKTWEGVYGGLVCTSVLLLIILQVADWADGSRLKLTVATLLAAVSSVLGDLYESRVKRAAGMKDSSQLLPGHGGVLDRIDGVVAAVPVFAFAWAWL
jgi:phosphatidate cytidylyltransferase